MGCRGTGRGEAREQLRVWHRARQGTPPFSWGGECTSQPCLGLQRGNVGRTGEPAWVLSQAAQVSWGFGELSTSPVPSEGHQHLQLGPQAAGTVPKAAGTAETFSPARLMPAPQGTLLQSIPTPPGPGGCERCFLGAGPAGKHPESSPLLRAGAEGPSSQPSSSSNMSSILPKSQEVGFVQSAG